MTGNAMTWITLDSVKTLKEFVTNDEYLRKLSKLLKITLFLKKNFFWKSCSTHAHSLEGLRDFTHPGFGFLVYLLVTYLCLFNRSGELRNDIQQGLQILESGGGRNRSRRNQNEQTFFGANYKFGKNFEPVQRSNKFFSNWGNNPPWVWATNSEPFRLAIILWTKRALSEEEQ